uniref:Uncharacterized protein n=1 Tax=Tanacetum cinerariifolium TaxID=118510 RepID=A0A6L2NGU7_TANCI|nr:hypothetical protein [Tanacetum cinerariifolium]
MVPLNNLGPDLNGKDVNEIQYRGFELKGYSDSDYARCNMDRKSTSGGIRGDIGINTIRNAPRAHYLPHSSMYVSLPFITIMRPWFATIGYIGEIREKRTLKKSCLPHMWMLLMGQIIQYLGGKTADSTSEADPGLSAPNDSIPSQQDKSEEEEVEKDDTHATSHDDALEQQKAKAEVRVASPKARPSYPNINQLTDLQVVKLKNIQWELPAEFQALPSQVSSIQEKLKTLDSLPSLLNKVTNTLNRFATMLKNASAGQASASPAEGEKNTTMDAKTNLQNELVGLLGIDTGPISLKVYRKDGIIEVIANFKVSDLHLAEWREVIQACPDKKEKGWKTIYGLIKTRMEYLDQTKKELKIDFNKPLKEQDPLNELNELANKKRKRTSNLKDHSRSLEDWKVYFTLVYATVQKLKKAFGLQGGKKIALFQNE